MKKILVGFLIIFFALTPFAFAGDIADTVANASHVLKFAGELYFVDGAKPDDTGDGTTPEKAKKTIGAGILLLGIGDALTVKPGIYTETGLDLSVDSTQLRCQTGVVIDPATGNGLTMSGDNCLLAGPLTILPAADVIGLNITGNNSRVRDVNVLGSANLSGVTVVGDLTDLINVKAAGVKSGGKTYDIQGEKTWLIKCGAAGNTASFGFYVSGAFGLLDGCVSTGNTGAGYYLDSGVTDYTIKNCSSGAGDGKWRDIDQINMWSGFTYDRVATSLAGFIANNETASYNVAQITGTIVLKNIHIEIVSALSANVTNFYLDIWDGTTSTPITKATGLTLSSAPAGSMIIRTEDSSEVMTFRSGATAFILENTSYKSPQTEVIVGQKGDDTATYLRMTYTTTDTPSSGTIRGYIEWEPKTDDGFVLVL